MDTNVQRGYLSVWAILALAAIGFLIWFMVMHHQDDRHSDAGSDHPGHTTIAVTDVKKPDAECACPESNTQPKFNNTQNFSGLTNSFATKHAVSGESMIVVDQIPNVNTTRVHIYSSSGTVWTERRSLDVAGVNASVAASGNYTAVVTQNSDGTDKGVGYVYSVIDGVWASLQQIAFASKPLGVDIDGEYLLVRFANSVALFKNGIMDFEFYKDIVPIDAKIENGRIFISIAGTAYLFKEGKTGGYDIERSILGNSGDFGKQIDISKTHISIQDDENMYIYSLDNLDCVQFTLNIKAMTTPMHQLGDSTMVIWEPTSVRVYWNCSKDWTLVKNINMGTSTKSYVSHSKKWTAVSKNIGVDANIGLSMWSMW